MSTGGAIALIITWLGTLIGSWVAFSTLRHSVAKEHANRRLALEEYTEEIGRYIRGIRSYLLELADAGVIDITRVDVTRFVPPTPPRYNGS